MSGNELTELSHLLGRLQLGEWTRAEFRSHSVHYGVYTQRQTDRYFVRIRVPLGIISVPQIRTLAAALNTWGPGECRLTTRQGVELHGLALNEIEPLLRCLAQVDLLSHETGGNSVRSIMICPHAGVGIGEPFDVTSHAARLAASFLRHPDFQNLPRKMKIGFSCCENDCARTAVQDLGFQARLGTQGELGFRVLIGGGTGALPRFGKELFEFLPADQVPICTEAVLRIFNRLGDRSNRQRARTKFLVQNLGIERVREEILIELDGLRRDNKTYSEATLVDLGPKRTASTPCCQREPSAAFQAWLANQTTAQAQAGFNMVRVSLAGGSITGPQLQAIANLADRFELTVRITPEQGILLRWARTEELLGIHDALREVGLLKRLAASHLVACPGSSCCSNAFTHAPGLAQAITARLSATANDEVVSGKLRIRLSGCPNGCALHAVADIGLEGVANRMSDEWFPAYRIWLGGRESAGSPCFGADLGMVPARRVPDCLADLVDFYTNARRPAESMADVLERCGPGPLAAVVHPYRFRVGEDRRNLAVDWGETGTYCPRQAKASGVC